MKDLNVNFGLSRNRFLGYGTGYKWNILESIYIILIFLKIDKDLTCELLSISL